MAEILKAFPTAYGAASQVTGGRGFPVYHVTTLSPFGAGSIVQAIADAIANGGGNIVFDVSGTIAFDGVAWVTQYMENISVLGQTAPQGGITITNINAISNNRLWLADADNVIWRYVKFRATFIEGAYDGVDNISSNNVIFDHCSISFGSDEGISTRLMSSLPSFNMTFQRLLIAECKTGGLIGAGDFPNLAGNMSYHKNLIVNSDHRFPNVTSDHRVDIVNNVVYDWYSRLNVYDGDGEINHIGNSYYLGHLTSVNTADNGSGHNLQCVVEGNTTLSIHADDTFIEGNYPDVGLDEADLFYVRGATDSYNNTVKASPALFTGTQFPLLGDDVPVLSAVDNVTDVLNDVGANAYLNDSGVVVRAVDTLDDIYIEMAKGNIPHEYPRNPNYPDSYLGSPVSTDYVIEYQPKYINFRATISATPVNTRPVGYDDDNDGINDAWFAVNVPNGATAQTTDATGYTYFERYVNQVDGDYVPFFLTETQKSKNKVTKVRAVKRKNI